MGYWEKPELTAQRYRPHPCPPPGLPAGERVCYSGDLVTMDDEGFLFFVGRRDNMIKSSGFRISPTEVEEVLCGHPDVQHAAVVGVPHEMLGQVVQAFVVLKESCVLEPGELLDYCVQEMPSYMVPKAIEVVDQFPKTSSGKVDYKTLQSSAESSTSMEQEITN